METSDRGGDLESGRQHAATHQNTRESPDPGDAEAGERNEKVLHTRIPGSLDREIKRRARNLGMSASTVVRNVLLHTFDLVEDIVTDSTNIALSIAGEDTERARYGRGARPPRPAEGDGDGEVLGWQPAILNLNAVCDSCNAILEKGTEAAIGIRERPGPRTIICRACLEALASRPADVPKRPRSR
jgi:hypothetical protein